VLRVIREALSKAPVLLWVGQTAWSVPVRVEWKELASWPAIRWEPDWVELRVPEWRVLVPSVSRLLAVGWPAVWAWEQGQVLQVRQGPPVWPRGAAG